MLCRVRGLTPLSVLSVAILSLGVAGVSNLSSSRADNTGVSTVTLAQAAADLTQGHWLYFQICAPCHGADASGGGPVPDLKTFPGTDEQFLQIALNGVVALGMPAWKGKLSVDQLQSIHAYIHSLPK
jgi:mono/diheme cytochrome c family protein